MYVYKQDLAKNNIYIYIYIYIYSKFPTVIESNPKAPFQLLLHRDLVEGAIPCLPLGLLAWWVCNGH